MAIYHFSAQVISRGRGQSAVAAAAYRSGEQLTDERTGEEKFYRREIQPDTMILAPDHSPEWVRERERLWNEVERSEKRVNSQLAREINIALPKELNNEQQKELVRNFIQKEFVDKGMIADVAIHRDDANNPHAHVMMTTREITPEGFGPKNRDWNKKELLEQWRGEWANHANRALEREGIQERISHLSHEARGLEQLPTVHLGHVASEMEKRGVQTERGDLNRERQEYNALVVDLQKYREEKQAIEQEKARKQEQKQKLERFTAAERTDLQKAANFLKEQPSLSNIQKRYEQINKWEDRINDKQNYLRWREKTIKEASEHFGRINAYEKQIEEATERKANTGLFERKAREIADQDISRAETGIESYKEKLKYHCEKLGFSTEDEFKRIKEQHEAGYPGHLEKIRSNRHVIHTERDVLQKAENAHKNAYVRKVASFPGRPEVPHMSYNTAKNLMTVNKKYGDGKVVPIEKIESYVNNRRQVDQLGNMDANEPKSNGLIQSKETGLTLLNEVFKGIEQATRTMQRDQERQRQQAKGRGQGKGRTRGR